MVSTELFPSRLCVVPEGRALPWKSQRISGAGKPDVGMQRRSTDPPSFTFSPLLLPEMMTVGGSSEKGRTQEINPKLLYS